MTQKLVKLKKKQKKKTFDHNQNKYITTQEFNKLTSENVSARLKQVNLATDFDDKLKHSNNKVTLNKVRHVLYQNELDKLSGKVKLISTKWLTNGLMNSYSILNGGKYFGENRSEFNLVFQPFSRYLTSKNGKIGSWQS